MEQVAPGLLGGRPQTPGGAVLAIGRFDDPWTQQLQRIRGAGAESDVIVDGAGALAAVRAAAPDRFRSILVVDALAALSPPGPEAQRELLNRALFLLAPNGKLLVTMPAAEPFHRALLSRVLSLRSAGSERSGPSLKSYQVTSLLRQATVATDVDVHALGLARVLVVATRRPATRAAQGRL